jgi:hypothetical protein
MQQPAIVKLAREGGDLSPLQAVAGQLWLAYGGDDADGAVARAIEAHWRAQGGSDPYRDCLSTRMACDGCGESYRLENLAVCPNCFNTYCHRHGRTCRCGWATLG